MKTDLAGLATGGGIGVLNTVAGIAPGNVDLIAPRGSIDAGDAGIRVSGNLNISAPVVLNASNISTGGSAAGTPAAPAAPAAPAIGNTVASTPPPTAAASSEIAKKAAAPVAASPEPAKELLPSDISVKVLGYGGGDGSSEDEEERRKRLKEAEKSAQ